jgi:hypothetical protein
VQRFADRVVGPFAGGVMTLSVATGAISPLYRFPPTGDFG